MKNPEILFNYDLYQEFLLKEIPSATRSVWIATADIKDLHIKSGNRFLPFISVLAKLVANKVYVRLLHAKEPGPRFRKHFDQEKALLDENYFSRNLCPRLHSKIIVVDSRIAYIGSANLTGAGFGARSKNRRNFEAGVLFYDNQSIVKIKSEYNQLYCGDHCKSCRMKNVCPDPIDSGE